MYKHVCIVQSIATFDPHSSSWFWRYQSTTVSLSLPLIVWRASSTSLSYPKERAIGLQTMRFLNFLMVWKVMSTSLPHAQTENYCQVRSWEVASVRDSRLLSILLSFSSKEVSLVRHKSLVFQCISQLKLLSQDTAPKCLSKLIPK